MKIKNKNSFLTGKKIFLRKLNVQDAYSKHYLQSINEQESTRYLEGVGIYPKTIQELKSYISEESKCPTSLLMGIFRHYGQLHVGNIHISRINLIHRNANYGIFLFKSFQGQGFAFEASNLLIQHCFNRLGLRRIQMHCTVNNKAAIKLYLRLGAREEGVLRQAFFTSNKFYDMKAFAILNKKGAK